MIKTAVANGTGVASRGRVRVDYDFGKTIGTSPSNQACRFCASFSTESETSDCIPARAEFLAAAGRFGVRVYSDFLAAYPSASENPMASTWYPLARMRECATTS